MGRQVVRYQRDDQEFSRAIGFFDATYASPSRYWLLIIPIRVAARSWADDDSMRS